MVLDSRYMRRFCDSAKFVPVRSLHCDGVRHSHQILFDHNTNESLAKGNVELVRKDKRLMYRQDDGSYSYPPGQRWLT